MKGFFNRHYITTRPDGAIIDSWSDGPNPEKDISNAICIAQGGYQFRMTVCYGFPENYYGEFPLLITTEENPPLYDMDGIPLYKWDAKAGVSGMIFPRTEEEIEADRIAIPAPPPTELEKLRSDIDYIALIKDVKL